MRNIPFTIIPLIIFNLVVFIVPNAVVLPGTTGSDWTEDIARLTLFSDAQWTLTAGNLMVVVGLLALLGEVVRSTALAKSALANHLVSILVLIIFVVEFAVVDKAANSTFFILTMIALIDVLTGIVITVRLASRDVTFAGPPR